MALKPSYEVNLQNWEDDFPKKGSRLIDLFTSRHDHCGHQLKGLLTLNIQCLHRKDKFCRTNPTSKGKGLRMRNVNKDQTAVGLA